MTGAILMLSLALTPISVSGMTTRASKTAAKSTRIRPPCRRVRNCRVVCVLIVLSSPMRHRAELQPSEDTFIVGFGPCRNIGKDTYLGSPGEDEDPT